MEQIGGSNGATIGDDDSHNSSENQSTTVFSGWLERRTGTGLGKRWKKRFFVIESHALVEYRDSEGSASKTFYSKDMADILIEDREKFTFGFRFATARWVTLRASSSEELDDWVANLRKAVLNERPPTPSDLQVKRKNPADHPLLNQPVIHTMSISEPASFQEIPSKQPQSETMSNPMARKGKDIAIPKLSILVNEAKPRALSDLRISPAHGHRHSIDSLPTPKPTGPGGDDHSTDEDMSSSNSEDEEDFQKESRGSKPKTTWGTSLRTFFSGSSGPFGAREGSLDSDTEEKQLIDSVTSEKKSLEIQTVQFIEYDVVEIFENQRWFPLSGWGTKMLPHDRASWTNRVGHSRTDWYKNSLDDKDTFAANTATLGTEDREEIPGGQIHVIKEQWHWEGPWRLAPLASLNPTHGHPHPIGPYATPNGNKFDPFKEGLRKDLRTDSLDSHPDIIPHTADSLELPPSIAQTPKSTSTKASTTVPAISSTTNSVVKSLKKRFIPGASKSASESIAVSSSSSGQPNLTINVNGNGKDGSALAHHPTTTSTVTSGGDQLHEIDRHSDGWAHGFDFPEFDLSIARGVIRVHTSIPSNNVRTRRWVRLRRRVVNVTGRVPTNIVPFVPSVISFQRQVVAEGYLGTKGRAGQWRSKYYKLVRLCGGLWDGGHGEGLIESVPTAFVLYVCECKEFHQNSAKTFRIEPSSVARLIMPDPPLTNTSFASNDSLIGRDSGAWNGANSLIVATNKFVSVDRMDIRKLNELAEDPPKSGRFEVILGKDTAFLLNADTREDALGWVSVLNKAAGELAKANPPVAIGQQDSGASVLPQHPLLHPTVKQAKARKGILKTFAMKKRQHKDEDEEDAEKEEGSAIQLEDTGEDPTAAPETVPPLLPVEADAKLKEVVNVTLWMNLRTFFQTFVGDKARFSIADFHNEIGDTEVKASAWNDPAGPPGGRQPRDEFDLDGFDIVPERLLTFKTATGAPIGPKVTRVEKHQRYHYFTQAKLLVVKTWAKSLDVPYGDSFMVMEKWIVQPDKADENKVNVRVLSGVHFVKSPLIKGTIQKSVESGSAKIYVQWRKKFLQFGAGSKKGPGGADDEVAETGPEPSPSFLRTVGSAVSAVGDVIVTVVQASTKGALLVFGLWYLMQFLWTLQRIATALETGDAATIVRRAMMTNQASGNLHSIQDPDWTPKQAGMM